MFLCVLYPKRKGMVCLSGFILVRRFYSNGISVYYLLWFPQWILWLLVLLGVSVYAKQAWRFLNRMRAWLSRWKE